MKDVKVITRHAVANYGSLLQTYATQVILEKLGYRPAIINYIPREEQGWYMALVRFRIRGVDNENRLKQLAFFCSQIINYSVSYFMFKRFRKGLIHETALYSSLDELRANPPSADVYMTGSDQVWGRISGRPYDAAFFLEFAPPGKKCIAYSASFGSETTAIEPDELKRMITKYSALNVRELSGLRILRDHGFTQCQHVLDPTLLLDRTDWARMASGQRRPQRYLLVYQLHQSKDFENYAEAFSKKTGLPIFRLSCSMNSVLQKGKLVYMTSPQQFLQYFMDAQYIITDSFHATVFSVIFNKRFVSVMPGTSSTRIKSILQVLGLEDRVLERFDDFRLINLDIDFDAVNKRLDALRKDSLNALKQALEH